MTELVEVLLYSLALACGVFVGGGLILMAIGWWLEQLEWLQ